MVTQYISSAWSAYRKNFGAIIGANIVLLFIVFAILFASAAPFVLALINAGLFSNSMAPLSAEQNAQLIAAIGSNMAAFFIGIIIVAVAGTVLRTGLVGIYTDALRGKRTEIGTMLSVAKEKFWTSLGSSILVGIIVMVVAFLLIVPTSIAFAGNVPAGAFLIFVEVIVLVLFALLFALRNQAIVVNGLGAVDSVMASYNAVKSNYLEFLAITLTLIVVSLVVSFVPVLGMLLSMLVVQPVMELAYTDFYMKKAGGAGKKVAARGRRK